MPQAFRQVSNQDRIAKECITFQAVLTPSANLPESPVGRTLKRSFAALHFLTRTKAIACEACLATERFRIR